MIVRHFLLSTNEVNAFIVACEETHEAMLIDAGEFNSEIAAFISEQKLDLKQVFITHDHFDHTDGLADYVKRYGSAVLSGTNPVGGCSAKVLGHGDEVRVGKLRGKVLSTPGHTPVGLSLAFPGHTFTGDALFAGSVGGTSSPTDAKRQTDAIREHIFTLPPDTILYVGHGPRSTVAIESRYNPFFV